MSFSDRPSWDETWVNVARVVARRSLCVRDQVGAVIVNQHNRIVATGYNGPPAGFKLPTMDVNDKPCVEWCERGGAFPKADRDLANAALALDYSDCPALHAEANALSVCDRSLRERGTLYVTSDICWGCAKLVANSGLLRVVIDGVRPAIHRNPARSREFLVTCGLAVVVV